LSGISVKPHDLGLLTQTQPLPITVQPTQPVQAETGIAAKTPSATVRATPSATPTNTLGTRYPYQFSAFANSNLKQHTCDF
jgi:hypothetical protein